MMEWAIAVLILIILGATTYWLVSRFHDSNLVEIKEGNVGIVTRNRFPMWIRQPMGAIAFKGEAGVQAWTLKPNTYFLWSRMYTVELVEITRIEKGEIGLVLAKYGAPSQVNQSLGPFVPSNKFQDAEAFLKNGGQQGIQMSVLTEPGDYFINTRLFKVTRVGVTHIEEGEIGLVNAKYGVPSQADQPLGPHIPCDDFQDAEAFLKNGGQQGIQMSVLRPGHYFINTDVFKVTRVGVTRIEEGEIGLVHAKYGAPPRPGRRLGPYIPCDKFQDAEAFLKNGGQQGDQISVLKPGDYFVNTMVFDVITTKNAQAKGVEPGRLRVQIIDADSIGIVTILDGPRLLSGEIAGPPIPLELHDSYQDGQRFLDAGGCMGLQEMPIPAGAYFFNPWLVELALAPVTVIPTNTVGVVLSHVGKTAPPNPDDSLVDAGHKGIQREPLVPGKYCINPKVMDVILVPTHPITLEWSKKEDKPLTNYDRNLGPLEVYSKDGFLFNIEITQVLKIRPEDASRMVERVVSPSRGGEAVSKLDGEQQRFAAIRNLIVRVLDPTINSNFHDLAKKHEAREFHEKLNDIQLQAKEKIDASLLTNGVSGLDTLIQNVVLPNNLQETLRKFKLIADEMLLEQEQQKLIQARQQRVLAELNEKKQIELAKLQLELKKRELMDQADAQRAYQQKLAEIKALIEGYGGFDNLRRVLELQAAASMNVSGPLVGDSKLTELMAAMLGGSAAASSGPANHQLPDILALVQNLFVQSNPRGTPLTNDGEPAQPVQVIELASKDPALLDNKTTPGQNSETKVKPRRAKRKTDEPDPTT